MLIFNVMPCSLKNSLQKALKNTDPSSVMDSSIPCSLATLVTNNSATAIVVKGWIKGMKHPYFVRQSTTTKIAEYRPETSKPSMKSMDISAQTVNIIGKGCNKLIGEVV